jgi:2-polyprenyl-3-methyl-5-hydroxy-6-metoxy-1,4-benzoquinol methylase
VRGNSQAAVPSGNFLGYRLAPTSYVGVIHPGQRRPEGPITHNCCRITSCVHGDEQKVKRRTRTRVDTDMARSARWTSSTPGQTTDRERERLASQGDALRPATERLLRAAGIGPGTRVLDCGSGGGDVSIIAGELVTSDGDVCGIDRDSGHVDAANRRVKDSGLTHVRFETADISSAPEGPFGAIVGRLVLMYQPDVEVSCGPLPIVSDRAV